MDTENRLNAMLAEYTALNQEIVSRSQQQYTLIATSWGIAITGIVGALVTTQTSIPGDIVKPISENLQIILMLLPLVLSVLTGNFIRNEHKTLRIIEYLYDILRPRFNKLISDNGIENQIWLWPDEEYSLSIKRPNTIIRPIVELCRYGIMLIPPAFILIQLSLLFGVHECESTLNWLFCLNSAVILFFSWASASTLFEYKEFFDKFSVATEKD